VLFPPRGALIASLFQAIANAGQDPVGSPTNAGYGQNVASILNGNKKNIDSRLNCLKSNGYIP
jgi:hypothetical protein